MLKKKNAFCIYYCFRENIRKKKDFFTKYLRTDKNVSMVSTKLFTGY